jgi:hypothetical protein
VALDAVLGAGLSAADVAVPVEEPESDPPPDDERSDEDPELLLDASADFVPLDDLRSTFAQPEPLNTMAGATNALRIAAPQIGHSVGPVAWTPCMTSVRWPLAQTYS